jgi:hypothetical protein
MTRLSLSSLALCSFLMGAGVMFTAPQLISDAHAGKDKNEIVVPPIREGTNPTKWEYFRKRYPTPETMQAMGQQGWELTATTEALYLFKRELP